MKIKKYTVVILCECGCDGSNVYHVQGYSPADAVVAAREKSPSPISIVAIFEGHLMDKSNVKMRSRKGP